MGRRAGTQGSLLAEETVGSRRRREVRVAGVWRIRIAGSPKPSVNTRLDRNGRRRCALVVTVVVQARPGHCGKIREKPEKVGKKRITATKFPPERPVSAAHGGTGTRGSCDGGSRGRPMQTLDFARPPPLCRSMLRERGVDGARVHPEGPGVVGPGWGGRAVPRIEQPPFLQPAVPAPAGRGTPSCPPLGLFRLLQPEGGGSAGERGVPAGGCQGIPGGWLLSGECGLWTW